MVLAVLALRRLKAST